MTKLVAVVLVFAHAPYPGLVRISVSKSGAGRLFRPKVHFERNWWATSTSKYMANIVHFNNNS